MPIFALREKGVPGPDNMAFIVAKNTKRAWEKAAKFLFVNDFYDGKTEKEVRKLAKMDYRLVRRKNARGLRAAGLLPIKGNEAGD